jgi:hypothetical protein
MVIQATRIRVLDPTSESLATGTSLTPRPVDLNGLTVGLLANGKRNADQLLANISDLLLAQYQIKGVVARNKNGPSVPASPQLLDELVQQCDVVITATGD